MWTFLNNWRYYGLGREEYRKCMKMTFANNLNSLRIANIVAALMSLCFAFFPILIDKNFPKAFFYFGTAIVAALLGFFVRYKYYQHVQGKLVSNRYIYTMIILFYANIIMFAIYLGVFANPGKLAGSFFAILICGLVLFNIPPLFNLCLTLSAMALFITASIWIKIPQDWVIDLTNALFAGCIAQFISWQITMYRMSLALNVSKLEAESTTDALTDLKNRRDFAQTFQRFLTNYRQTDNFLCLGIMDIDFFKNYNDHYGHLQGDECLRAIGKTLNHLKDLMGVYTARVGGEEFALLWFEKEAANADNVASLINQMVRNLNIPHETSSVSPNVTVSIGIHVARCGTVNHSQTMYDLADKALYAAKSGGRNRAVITS